MHPETVICDFMLTLPENPIFNHTTHNSMKNLLLCSLAGAALALGMTACGPQNATKLLGEQPLRHSQTLAEGWSFREADTSTTLPDAACHHAPTERTVPDWTPAQVPGTVHTDLLANQLIPEPFAGTTEPDLQWIGHRTWEYKTSFTPSAEITSQQVQELVFKGLDTYADVYLNDSLVLGGTDNMFVEWRIPVNDILKADSVNTLRIVFHPAYETALPLAQAWPVKLPADNDSGEWKTSVFTRKAPYHFGWDWGPRYVTVGIWRPVYLDAWSSASIGNIQFVRGAQDSTRADFVARVSLRGVPDGETAVRVMLADSAGTIYGQADALVGNADAADNGLVVEIPFAIANPKLWWPNGMGDANLYAVNTLVTDRSGRLLDKNTQRIGVRTIRLVQKPDGVGDGESFQFYVNGEPCFIKGANYIPQDVFLTRVDTARYEELIGVAVASNMNMLRIWGGGVYEEDLFYDLCDERGMMVWEDFMFACSFYPWDSAFLDNVRREAVYNVRRLRNHPSLAIWCGNNEIDEAWYHWGYQQVYGWDSLRKAQIKHGIDTLFRGVLADVVAAEDSGRQYYPSSPMYGRGNPLSRIKGDVHYWGVFHDEEPFSVYKDKPGRFSNEYGFVSLACYDTYREYLTPDQMWLYSPAMILHQKTPKGYRLLEEYMARDLPLLKDDFRTYVYLSQIIQAEGIKIAMEGHRSKRPFNQGTMYWQLNDCYPVISWSSIDSRYRWKALQYYAVRSFAPTLLSFERVDSSATAVLWAITDRLAPQEGEVSLRLQDFGGGVLWDTTLNANVAANSNRELLRSTDAELLRGADSRGTCLVAEGVIGGDTLRSIYWFVPFKDLALPKADYAVSYKQVGPRSVEAKLTAHNLLKSVLFDAEALQGNPSDAYFDLLPGETKTVVLNFTEDIPSGGIDALGISVRTLNDLAGRRSERPVRENVK